MELKGSTGLEIYMVAEDETVFSTIDVYTNQEDLLEHLALLNPKADCSTKVYHGILMPANILPPDLINKRCFVVALTIEYVKEQPQLKGTVFESDCDGDVDILADEIEQLLKSVSTMPFRPKIDNMFVLYGYELETCLSINMDSMDEEVIDTCKKIANTLKEMEFEDEGD